MTEAASRRDVKAKARAADSNWDDEGRVARSQQMLGPASGCRTWLTRRRWPPAR